MERIEYRNRLPHYPPRAGSGSEIREAVEVGYFDPSTGARRAEVIWEPVATLQTGARDRETYNLPAYPDTGPARSQR